MARQYKNLEIQKARIVTGTGLFVFCHQSEAPSKLSALPAISWHLPLVQCASFICFLGNTRAVNPANTSFLRFFPWALALSSLLLCSISHAKTVQNIYDVSVLVPDQTSTARKEALQDAMLTVLVRVSGKASPEKDNPTIQRALKRSESYVQQFSYSSSDVVETIESEEGETVEQAMVQLNARFGKSAISQLLRDAGLPIWSSNRPSVLVWAVVDHPSGRSFLQQYEKGEGEEALTEVMQQRGLPLQSPRYDTQDRMQVTSSALWQEDEAKIVAASKRYAPDSILFGRVALTSSGKWIGNWQYIFQEQTYPINTTPNSLESFVADGVDGVVNILSQRYAINTLQAGENILLEVGGIQSFEDYTHITKHLESLEPVNHVLVSRVSGEYVYYQLAAEGGVTLLQELINLGGVLKEVEDPSTTEEPDNAEPPALIDDESETDFGTTVLRYRPSL